MTTKDRLFAEYAGFHMDSRNRATHFAGIPIIVGSLIGLLLRWDFFVVGPIGVSAGHVVLAAGILFCLVVAPSLALPMLAAAGFLAAIGRALPVWLAAALFVFGLILVLVGHVTYEGKSPAFLKNVAHLLVGPLWVLEEAMGSEKRDG